MAGKSKNDPLESARTLCDQLQRQKLADEAWPGALVERLPGSSLSGLLTPLRYGGREINWGEFEAVAEAVGLSSGPAACLLSEFAIGSALVGRMGQLAQDEVWRDSIEPRVVTAFAWSGGSGRRGADEFELTGDWDHVAGAAHADWVLTAAQCDGEALVLLMPRSAFEAEEISYPGGLRGIGLQRLSAGSISVPEHRTITLHDLFAMAPPGATINTGRLYEAAFMPYYANAQLGTLLGCARGAYDEYASITSRWVAAIGDSKVATMSQVQSRLAESSAEIKAASLLLREISALLSSDSGTALSAAQLSEINRDASHLAHLCLTAVTRLVQQMGARGIFENNPLQRRYRDIRAMVGHHNLNWQRNMAAFGRHELGVSDEDDGLLTLDRFA